MAGVASLLDMRYGKSNENAGKMGHIQNENGIRKSNTLTKNHEPEAGFSFSSLFSDGDVNTKKLEKKANKETPICVSKVSSESIESSINSKNDK